VSPPDRQATPDEGWESLKVDELKEELEARGLPKSGTKAELVARLEEDDAAPAAEDLVAEAAEGSATETADATEAEAPETPEAPDEGIDEEVVPPEEPAEEPSADEVEEAEGPDEEAAAPTRRRRGSAEVSTGERRAARVRPEGGVVVRARSKYVRSAPRKARLVMDHIRGKEVEHARAILTHAPRAVADDILKLLNSAIANAESNYELGPDELRVRKAFVDEGPTIKRYRPRALGRATRINKRTSHMTIELTTTEDGR
jgi:ribosomal protein L22